MPDLNTNAGRVLFMILTIAVILLITLFFSLVFDDSFGKTLLMTGVGAAVGCVIVLFRTRRA